MMPQLSFKKFFDYKLSGLHTFDIIVISISGKIEKTES